MKNILYLSASLFLMKTIPLSCKDNDNDDSTLVTYKDLDRFKIILERRLSEWDIKNGSQSAIFVATLRKGTKKYKSLCLQEKVGENEIDCKLFYTTRACPYFNLSQIKEHAR